MNLQFCDVFSGKAGWAVKGKNQRLIQNLTLIIPECFQAHTTFWQVRLTKFRRCLVCRRTGYPNNRNTRLTLSAGQRKNGVHLPASHD
jgi:hypothetical protein